MAHVHEPTQHSIFYMAPPDIDGLASVQLKGPLLVFSDARGVGYVYDLTKPTPTLIDTLTKPTHETLGKTIKPYQLMNAEEPLQPRNKDHSGLNDIVVLSRKRDKVQGVDDWHKDYYVVARFMEEHHKLIWKVCEKVFLLCHSTNLIIHPLLIG